MIVLDASAAGAFLLPDEAGEWAEFSRRSVFDNDVTVPEAWPTEVANLIAKATSQRRLSPHQAVAASAAAERLRLSVHVHHGQSIADVAALARAHRLSAYDASYALLAANLRLALLTGDGPLRHAADALGIRLLQP